MNMANNMQMETIYGQVVSKANNYTIGNNEGIGRHIVKTPELKAYERDFVNQCKIYGGRLIDGHFTLYATIYESSTRYDLDNALKTILDCLQMANAITNDNLCVKIVADKKLDRRNPRVVFAIEEHEPRLF